MTRYGTWPRTTICCVNFGEPLEVTVFFADPPPDISIEDTLHGSSFTPMLTFDVDVYRL
jgi:hypothetical protein